MKTEEKVMTFSHNTISAVEKMRERLNKELSDGWKVKPATFHSLGDKFFIVCLYREAHEKQALGPGMP